MFINMPYRICLMVASPELARILPSFSFTFITPANCWDWLNYLDFLVPHSNLSLFKSELLCRECELDSQDRLPWKANHWSLLFVIPSSQILSEIKCNRCIKSSTSIQCNLQLSAFFISFWRENYIGWICQFQASHIT